MFCFAGMPRMGQGGRSPRFSNLRGTLKSYEILFVMAMTFECLNCVVLGSRSFHLPWHPQQVSVALFFCILLSLFNLLPFCALRFPPILIAISCPLLSCPAPSSPGLPCSIQSYIFPPYLTMSFSVLYFLFCNLSLSVHS